MPSFRNARDPADPTRQGATQVETLKRAKGVLERRDWRRGTSCTPPWLGPTNN